MFPRRRHGVLASRAPLGSVPEGTAVGDCARARVEMGRRPKARRPRCGEDLERRGDGAVVHRNDDDGAGPSIRCSEALRQDTTAAQGFLFAADPECGGRRGAEVTARRQEAPSSCPCCSLRPVKPPSERPTQMAQPDGTTGFSSSLVSLVRQTCPSIHAFYLLGIPREAGSMPSSGHAVP